MWKILNWLFGWHYVNVKDCDSYHIRRVKMMPEGYLMGVIVMRPFRIYKSGNIEGGYHIQSWHPLTWKMRDYSNGDDPVSD